MWRHSVLLLPVTLLILGCGSGNADRQLQSITIQATTSVGQVQFTASGTFSEPPTTVAPLPVDWANGLLSPPVETLNYTLSTQPYVLNCAGSPPGTPVQVTVFAPQNPSAPASGSSPWGELVMAHSAITCP
jgi:hypothetical protein